MSVNLVDIHCFDENCSANQTGLSDKNPYFHTKKHFKCQNDFNNLLINRHRVRCDHVLEKTGLRHCNTAFKIIIRPGCLNLNFRMLY